MKKAIYIMQDDHRENRNHMMDLGDNIEMQPCTGHIEYSYKEACAYALRRIWYGNPEYRTWITGKIKELGVIKAYKDCASGWIYCVTFEKKMIDTSRL